MSSSLTLYTADLMGYVHYSMPKCDLMSWVTPAVLFVKVIITDIDVLVTYSSIVSRWAAILSSVTVWLVSSTLHLHSSTKNFLKQSE